MKTHTSQFKEQIKKLGRQLDSQITYTLNNEEIVLGKEQLNAITPHYEGDILKSVMKQLDIDSNIDIPIGTEVNYKFGVKTRSGKNIFDGIFEQGARSNSNGSSFNSTTYIRSKNQIPVEPSTQYTIKTTFTDNTNGGDIHYLDSNKAFLSRESIGGTSTKTTPSNCYYINIQYYNSNGITPSNVSTSQVEKGNTATTYEEFGQYEYLDYGNYIVYSTEKQEDTRSYKIVCYDKMLYAMKDYERLDIEYPITLKNYLSALCTKIGLTLKDTNFVNYNKEIENELYLDSEGNSLDYTYRDVLDEIAGATASTICINEDDELEVRYINATEGNNIYAESENLASVMEQNGQMSKTGTGRECTMTKISSGTASPRIQFANDFFEINTTYYITFKVKGNWNKFNFGTWINNRQISLTGDIIPTNEYQTITCYFTYPSTKYTSDIVYFRNNDQYVSIGQTITITDFMISKVDVPFEPYGADLIDEEYLKDINVNFGEKYGPVNSVVFSRSAESDNIYRQDEDSIEENGLHEIKIKDNQILNGNNRDEFIDGVFNQLNGFEYYANDFSSTGIAYYDLCDRYNVKVDNNIYSCIMMNNELDITQGLEEQIHTDIPENSETDYKKADKTDRRINETWIIANKQEGYIEALTSRTTSLEENTYTITQVNDLIQNAESGITNTFSEAGGNNIFRNTGLWFENSGTDSQQNPYEFWTGVVARVKEENASNMNALSLQNTTLKQQQEVVNGYYTISFKYKKPIQLANASVIINGNEFELTETDETEFTQTIEVKSQYIEVDFICDVNDGCEIYDLMVNSGQTKLAYSQNQNETTTDTVNISKGITITSSDLDVKFKADADGIRILDSSNNITTKFTDVGMTTGEATINEKSTIVGTYWEEVNEQTWITRL